jgi:hypothetical protein
MSLISIVILLTVLQIHGIAPLRVRVGPAADYEHPRLLRVELTEASSSFASIWDLLYHHPRSVHHHPGRIQLAGQGRIRDHRVGMVGDEMQPSERGLQVRRHFNVHIIHKTMQVQAHCITQ